MKTDSKVKRKAGRPQESKALDRDEFLRSALRAFAKYGYGGVTLKSLSTEMGISDSLLNYHFGTKKDLWKKAMMLVGSEIMEELDSLFVLIDDLDGLEQLKLYNKKIVHVCAKYPEFQQVVVQEVFSDNPRSSWLIHELLQPIFSFINTIIAEEQKKGTIKKIPPAHLASFVIGAITTFFSRTFQMKEMYGVDTFDPDSVTAHANYINDLILGGLLVR